MWEGPDVGTGTLNDNRPHSPETSQHPEASPSPEPLSVPLQPVCKSFRRELRTVARRSAATEPSEIANDKAEGSEAIRGMHQATHATCSIAALAVSTVYKELCPACLTTVLSVIGGIARSFLLRKVLEHNFDRHPKSPQADGRLQTPHL